MVRFLRIVKISLQVLAHLYVISLLVKIKVFYESFSDIKVLLIYTTCLSMLKHDLGHNCTLNNKEAHV